VAKPKVQSIKLRLYRLSA